MTRRTDQERLLADVIADEADAGFHEALLGETLRLARRRRRFRQARRAVVVVAALVGLSALVWQRFPPRAVTPGVEKGSYAIVRSQPPPATALVTTQPLPMERLVASATTADIVETSPDSGHFREISDDDLLAMVAPKVAALVRRGPHAAELIVLEPTGEDVLPQN